jgi:hypothetical protein
LNFRTPGFPAGITKNHAGSEPLFANCTGISSLLPFAVISTNAGSPLSFQSIFTETGARVSPNIPALSSMVTVFGEQEEAINNTGTIIFMKFNRVFLTFM